MFSQVLRKSSKSAKTIKKKKKTCVSEPFKKRKLKISFKYLGKDS